MKLAIILIVFIAFLGAIFTAGYNEDRTFNF
jgi:hypothetical protein